MAHIDTPDGRRINWDRHGEGPTVVLCHGTPWSSWTWHAVAGDLAVDHTVITWDMPGYGASSRGPDRPVDLLTQAATFAWLLREWGAADGSATVVAHDIGGAVAVGAHLLHGAEYRMLVLVDAVVQRPWGSPLYSLIQDHPEVFAQLPAGTHRALLRDYVGGALATHPSEPDLQRLTAPWLGAAGQAAFYRQIRDVRHADTDVIAARLDEVRCPTRVVWGAEDTWLPLASGHSLADALGADIEVVEAAGHLVQTERPTRVADAVRRAVARPPCETS